MALQTAYTRIRQGKADIILVLNSKGLTIDEDTKIGNIPELASELVSEVDMLNANGKGFGSTSVLEEAEAPTCPELETVSEDFTTMIGQLLRIECGRNNIITVLNTKGITIPSETPIDGIVEYASKIRSTANMSNANGTSFGSSTYSSNYYLATETQNILTDENGNLLTL